MTNSGDPKLRVYFPEGEKDFALPSSAGAMFIVGRGHNANLKFDSNPELSYISNRHCNIKFEDGGFMIADGVPGKRSSAGTYINGQELTETYQQLRPGDKIRLGNLQHSLTIEFMAGNISISMPTGLYAAPEQEQPAYTPPRDEEYTPPIDPFAETHDDAPANISWKETGFSESIKPADYNPPPPQQQQSGYQNYDNQQNYGGYNPPQQQQGYNPPPQQQQQGGYGDYPSQSQSRQDDYQPPAQASYPYADSGYSNNPYGQVTQQDYNTPYGGASNPYAQQGGYQQPAYGNYQQTPIDMGYSSMPSTPSAASELGVGRVILGSLLSGLFWFAGLAAWFLYLFERSNPTVTESRIVTALAFGVAALLTGFAITFSLPKGNKINAVIWGLISGGIILVGVMADRSEVLHFMANSGSGGFEVESDALLWIMRVVYAAIPAVLFSSFNGIIKPGNGEPRLNIIGMVIVVAAWVGIAFLVSELGVDVASELAEIFISDSTSFQTAFRISSIISGFSFGFFYGILSSAVLLLALRFFAVVSRANPYGSYPQNYGGYYQ